MKTRIISAIIMIMVVIPLIIIGGLPFKVLAIALAILGLKELIDLRKNRSNKMNIPAFFIFTNKELDKILKIRPETIDELKNANILSDVKIKTHGEAIINEINKH